MSNEWNADEALCNMLRGFKGDATPVPSYAHQHKRYKEGDKIPPAAWKEAMQIFAQHVAVYGEEYLPFFARAEREYNKSLNKMSALERVKMIAMESALETDNGILYNGG